MKSILAVGSIRKGSLVIEAAQEIDIKAILADNERIRAELAAELSKFRKSFGIEEKEE